ncbi:MAG: PIG-L family deacetylase [Chloroflexi bacterium]|nr:PIG-L family deacetylase [Chloroflexota bacterium]
MSEERPRALVIAAHPDDAEFTSGGTIARLVREQGELDR